MPDYSTLSTNYMRQLMADLEEYASLCGTELGEAGELLCALSGYTPYLSEAFTIALRLEMEEFLHNMKSNYTIEERVETREHTATHLKDRE